MKRLMQLAAISVLCLGTAQAETSSFMEFGNKDYKSDSSRWQFDVGMNYLEYPTNLPEYEGEHYTARSPERQNVFGPGIGLGREFYLGAGLSTSVKGGVFYFKTLDTSKGEASEDLDLELASKRSLHEISGGNASVSINYVFEGKSLDIQPFIFGGVMVGTANISRSYSFRGLAADKSDKEFYKMKVQDEFSAREGGVGVNFISKKGIVFSLKASESVMAFTERDIQGEYQLSGNGIQEYKDNSKKEVTVKSTAINVGFTF